MCVFEIGLVEKSVENNHFGALSYNYFRAKKTLTLILLKDLYMDVPHTMIINYFYFEPHEKFHTSQNNNPIKSLKQFLISGKIQFHLYIFANEIQCANRDITTIIDFFIV